MRWVRIGVYFPIVIYLRKFGALALLFAALVTPTMACAVADSPMISEERACCQMMGSKCGQKGMPGSQGCCHKVPGSVYDKALNTRAVALHPVAITVVWLPTSELLNPLSIATWRTEHLENSPPKHPPSTISVLRI